MMQTPRSTTAAKSRATGFLRIAVSGALLAALLAFAPIGDLLARMKAVSPILWLAVLAGFLLGHAFSAAKWRWVIGGGISYPRALKAHFAGLAANIALPGVAGGDLVRAGIVMKGSGRKTALAVGSLADRLIDTAVLIIIAAGGAIWLGARAGVHPAGLAVAAVGVIVVGLAGVVLLRPLAALIRRLAPKGKLGLVVADVATAMEEMASRRVTLLGCIMLSGLIQLSFALMNGAIAKNIGVDAPLAAWVFAWPLAKLVATLPVSFGGLGVREASIAGLLTPMGHEAAGVIAASLIWQTIQYAGALIGALAQSISAPTIAGGAGTSHG